SEGIPGVQIGVVVDLDERFEADAQALAIIEDTLVMIRNPPWSGIEVEVLVETAGLLEAAELGKAVAAAQGPTASARAVVVFEDLHLVSDLVQLERRDETSTPRPEDQDGGPLRVPLEPDRPPIARLGREPQGGHGLIHRGASGGGADHGEQTPATHRCCGLFGHGGPL